MSELTVYLDNTSPSVSDTVKVNGAAFDLTGCHVTFRMRIDGNPNAALKVDAIATITQSGTSPNFTDEGGVRYDWQAGDTDTGGLYRAWWVVELPSGAVQDTPEFTVEVADHTTINRNYCTLDELKSALNLAQLNFADTEAIDAINAASRAIDDVTGRRFYPDIDAAQTRQYRPQNSGYCLIDDLCEFTTLVAQSTTWTRDQDFYLEPSNGPANGMPYTGIRTIARPFLFTLADVPAGWAAFDGRIQVTGRYGWLTTPAPIKEASLIVAERLLRIKRDAPWGVVSTGIESPAARVSLVRDVVGDMLDPYKLTFIA